MPCSSPSDCLPSTSCCNTAHLFCPHFWEDCWDILVYRQPTVWKNEPASSPSTTILSHLFLFLSPLLQHLSHLSLCPHLHPHSHSRQQAWAAHALCCANLPPQAAPALSTRIRYLSPGSGRRRVNCCVTSYYSIHLVHCHALPILTSAAALSINGIMQAGSSHLCTAHSSALFSFTHLFSPLCHCRATINKNTPLPPPPSHAPHTTPPPHASLPPHTHTLHSAVPTLLLVAIPPSLDRFGRWLPSPTSPTITALSHHYSHASHGPSKSTWPPNHPPAPLPVAFPCATSLRLLFLAYDTTHRIGLPSPIHLPLSVHAATLQHFT